MEIVDEQHYRRPEEAVVQPIMEAFAARTGLSPKGLRRRYLWTDAFAVCNYLTLLRRTGDSRFRELSIRLIDQVHDVLGRHREDDRRRGWISGLDEAEGERRPTAGGLRIGKELNERRPDEPFDPRLEWERDGQYYHYLTQWMHTLGRAADVLAVPRYHAWAVELARAAHSAFIYTPVPGEPVRMYWKTSIDLSRPLVPSQGAHDPLDGLVTLCSLPVHRGVSGSATSGDLGPFLAGTSRRGESGCSPGTTPRCGGSMVMSVAQDTTAYRRVVELRRSFHEHPELAFEEVRTAEMIRTELDRLGIDNEYGGKGGAVIGRLQGGTPEAPTVALRAEMDALPAQERTGLPFASKIPGCMHACGHDAHMAMVLGAAAHHVIHPPPGNVVYVFQPAEERGGGARVVLKSGALDEADAIFAGHVTHHYRVGEIMITSGAVTAQSDGFAIRITGKGGHGARPHEAIDAVVIAGMLITSIQTLVSRETDPVHPAVVTIGRVAAGTAPNVIAEDAVLKGTIRTTCRRCESICNAASNGLGGRPPISIAPSWKFRFEVGIRRS